MTGYPTLRISKKSYGDHRQPTDSSFKSCSTLNRQARQFNLYEAAGAQYKPYCVTGS